MLKFIDLNDVFLLKKDAVVAGFLVGISFICCGIYMKLNDKKLEAMENELCKLHSKLAGDVSTEG